MLSQRNLRDTKYSEINKSVANDRLKLLIILGEARGTGRDFLGNWLVTGKQSQEGTNRSYLPMLEGLP